MTPCPICHGSAVVWYDLAGHRLQTPIPCRCCKKTGVALWTVPAPTRTPAEVVQIEAGRNGGRKSRRNHPTPHTVLALVNPVFADYKRACADAGLTPTSYEAFRRNRINWRTAPEYVAGRRGRRCSQPSAQ